MTRHRFSDAAPFATFIDGVCAVVGGKAECHKARKAAAAQGRAAFVAMNAHRPGYQIGHIWNSAGA
jgi:hypothetical protein